MDIRNIFKKDDSYFGRRRPLFYLFQLVSIAALLANSIFASGWLDTVFGEYLPPAISIFFALLIVVGLEFVKKIAVVFTAKEYYKYSILDAVGISAIILFTIITVTLSIVGIDAKAAKVELNLHSKADSTETKSAAPTLSIKAIAANTAKEQTRQANAIAAANTAAAKLDSISIAKEEKAAKRKQRNIDKITALKGRIFSVNKGFIIALEILFFYSSFIVGFLLSTKPDNQSGLSAGEIKKLKARYSAAYARHKKTGEQKELDLMQEIEFILESNNETPPNTKP